MNFPDVRFLFEECNEELWTMILSLKPEKRVDIYELARILRNTLVAFTKKRLIFPGLNIESKMSLEKKIEKKRKPDEGGEERRMKGVRTKKIRMDIPGSENELDDSDLDQDFDPDKGRTIIDISY